MKDIKTQLPKDFLTFDETIKLIQSDTREAPKVDIDFIVSNFEYISPAHNFTIKLLKRDSSGRIVPNGVRYVQLANEYEAATFEHVVKQKYQELVGHQFDDSPVQRLTTMVTDADNGGNTMGAIMTNGDSETVVGANI